MSEAKGMTPARVTVAIVAVVAAIAGLVGVGWLLGQRALAPAEDLVSPVESPEPGEGEPDEDAVGEDEGEPPPEDFVEFRDEEIGLVIEHPESWELQSVDDPQVRLLATPNHRDTVLVRATPLDFDVPDDDEALAELHGFTEDIVRSEEGVEVLIGPEIVAMAEQPATYYLYTFEDELSGQEGAHAHYFLFVGDMMVTLVFQALPTERFLELADTFDRIAASMRLEP